MLVPHRAMTRLIATATITAGVAVAWLSLAAPTVVAQAADVTVRGCVERDAAASTPIYKLVTPAPAVKIYRLTRAEGHRHRRPRRPHGGYYGCGVGRPAGAVIESGIGTGGQETGDGEQFMWFRGSGVPGFRGSLELSLSRCAPRNLGTRNPGTIRVTGP